MKYVEYYQCREDFSLIQENVLKEAGEYTKTRYQIITLSLKQLIDTHADFGELLLVLCLLDSQFIPRSLLDAYKNDLVVDNFIYHLKKYSLITTQSSNLLFSSSTICIHRSTQEIGLFYLTQVLNLRENSHLITSIAKTFENYLDDIMEEQGFSCIMSLAIHCERFLSHAHLLNKEIIFSISSQLGGVYFYQGYHIRAKQMLEKSLNGLEKYCSKDSLRVAWTLTHLGNIYRGLGNYEKAKDILEQSLQIYQKHSENPHLSAWALAHLGNVYKELGDFDKAKSFLDRSLFVSREKFPDDHIRIAWILVHLGNIYKGLGDYHKAKSLLEESFLIYQRYSEDFGTAWVLEHLGDSYTVLGDYKKAKSLLEESLSIYERNFGHCTTHYIRAAWVLVYLGKVYKEIGDYHKAKDLLEESLRIYKANFSEDYVRLAWILGNLGSVYLCLDDKQQSKQFLEKSLKLNKKYFKETHIKTAWILMQLGIFYKESKDFKKAKNFFEKSLNVYESNYGKEHIITARVLLNLGDVYLREGQIETAENLINHALVVFQRDNHPGSYRCLEILAELSLKKSTYTMNKADQEKLKTQAVNYLEQALEIARTYFPKGSIHITRIQSNLEASNNWINSEMNFDIEGVSKCQMIN